MTFAVESHIIEIQTAANAAERGGFMADYLAHPEDIREEMLAGKIIAMAPPAIRHSEIAFNIACAFQSFLRGKPCKAYSNGVAAFLTEKDSVIPDAISFAIKIRFGRTAYTARRI